MSSNISISVNGVSKRYDMYAKPKDRLLQFISVGARQYYKEFWALRDISFELKKGETVGILGRNGSGKSTLLQVISGTLSPTYGTVKTEGVVAALLELGSGFNPDFSGRENIYLNGTILGFSREEMKEKFDEIVSFADIGDHLDQPVKTYSSGMAVRLAFAVQACVEPQILIVDEALAVGDEKFQRKCFEYIEKLRKNGCSILLVTHSTATIEKFCQRAILLHKGNVHGIGSAKEIVDQYHALLYSDEQAYVRYINNELESNNVSESSISEIKGSDTKLDETSNLRACIKKWNVVNSNNEQSEFYYTGDSVKIIFHVDILKDINELQAGILIRTVEGVTVFGTSTLYHEKNVKMVSSGNRLTFSFDLKLDICPGSYFITLAIAEAISHNDMAYLDRKTDVIILKVNQLRIKGSGIAALQTNITINKS